MSQTPLLTAIGLLTLTAPALAHGDHTVYPGGHLLHLLAHHWTLLVAASALALAAHLRGRRRSIRTGRDSTY